MSVSNVTTPLTVTRRRMTSLVFRGQYVRVIKSVLKLMRCESCVVCQILITTTSSTVDTTAAAAGAIVSRSWFSLSLSLSLCVWVCVCWFVDNHGSQQQSFVTRCYLACLLREIRSTTAEIFTWTCFDLCTVLY